MAGIALKALTVDFHEPGFNAKLAQENQFGPWFTLSDKERQQLGDPMGPQNPQALNRYSYTLNNPVRYVDPSGHFGVTLYATGPFRATFHFTHEDMLTLWDWVNQDSVSIFLTAMGTAALVGLTPMGLAAAAAAMGAPVLVVAAILILGAIGVATATIISILGGIGLGLRGLDALMGSQGVDFHITPNGQIVVGPPTVERQGGIWLAPHPMLPAVEMCPNSSTIDDCIAGIP